MAKENDINFADKKSLNSDDVLMSLQLHFCSSDRRTNGMKGMPDNDKATDIV